MGLKKRLLLAAMTAALCVSVTACFGNKNNQGQVSEAESTQATEEQTAGYRDDVTCVDLESAVIAALGEDYWTQADMPGIEDLGLTADMYTEYLYKAPMISTNVDTIIIVKAAEGRMEDVKKVLETYRENMIADTFQYPINIPKIQNSMIAEYGNYAVLVQLGADYAMNASQEAMEKNPNITSDEIAKLEAEAVIAQNQKALDAIEFVLK